MSAHTPGPWIAVGRWVEHPSDKRPDICNCDPDSMGQDGRSDAETCANARLIAAAPDLLDAVREAERTFRRYAELHAAKGPDGVEKAQHNLVLADRMAAAIAKAEGRV